MPHMVVSYAKSLEDQVEIQELVQTVWDAADRTGLFRPEAIKVRALPVTHFLTGNKDIPFVHIDAKLFVGRTDEQKQAMVKTLFDALDKILASDVKISVEAIDMDKPNYLAR